MDANKIGVRVASYLFRRRQKDPSADFLTMMMRRLPDTMVFGGMIRDMALGKVRKFNSDIDLVSFSSRVEISKAIAGFNPSPNKFGGFRFGFEGRIFDIWSFEDTWAFRAGLVKGDAPNDLCKTTFFNLDAICQPLGSRGVICGESYLSDLNNRILEINLMDNPAPHKAAARAIRLAWEHELFLSVKLQEFILENSPDVLWRQYFSRSLLKKIEDSLAQNRVGLLSLCNVNFSSPHFSLF